MDQVDATACVHCTFLNTPARVRCAMCRRNIRKRERDLLTETSSQHFSPNKSSDEKLEEYGETDISTLFSTAAGNPVVISESLLQSARARLEQIPDAAHTSPSSDNRNIVSSLFSTAAGIPVVISESSLQSARARLEQIPDAAHTSPSSDNRNIVSSLFSTAAGNPVVISESSLQSARARIDVADEKSSCSSDVSAGASAGDESPSAATPSFVRPSRGSFVVPFARVNLVRQRSSPQETIQTRGPQPLLFDFFSYSSLAMVLPPSYEKIVTDRFFFKSVGCSSNIIQLLGLSSDSDIVRPESFRKALLNLGAKTNTCTDEWCQQMLKSTLLKLRGLSLHCSPPLPVFSVTHSLIYLCFKYNREFVYGERPALRVITEGDVLASSLVVVNVVTVSLEERLAPHTCVGVISDGCYEIKVSLDVPLTNLVREGILRSGQKLLICGSKMLLKNFCTPLECRNDVVLSINYNCTRPVNPDSVLGLYHANPPVIPSDAIHPLGGLIPSLHGVVERVLPPIFIEQATNNSNGHNSINTASNGVKILRNLPAQLKALNRAERELSASVDSFSNRRLCRISSLVLTCDKKEDIVVQLWEDCGEGCMGESLEEWGCELPTEGSTILIFAVIPSRSRPSHPFQNSKVVYTRGRLDYKQLIPPKGFVRQIQRSVNEIDAMIPAGAPIDCGGLFWASTGNEIMTSFIIVMLNDDENVKPSFCIVDLPSSTPAREITTVIPTTSFTPIIIQNASFIRRADEDFGSDCIHLLVNEFTQVLQRPSAPSLRTVIASLEYIREKFKSKTSITARATELLRLRQLSDEARSDVRRFSSEIGGGDISINLTSSGKSRLPYYMRKDIKGPIAKGVVIPQLTEIPHITSQVKIVALNEEKTVNPSTVQQHGGKRHFFGNIIGMRLLRSFESGRTESIELLADSIASSNQEFLNTKPDEIIVKNSILFEINIQFGAVLQQSLIAKIKNPQVFNSMLEQRTSTRSVCALAVDEGCVEYFVQRTKILEDLQRNPEEIWWWLFSLSFVIEDNSFQSEKNTVVMWLKSEWKMLLDMIAGGLKDSLFKFSVDPDGDVTRVVFIKENCSLTELLEE